MKAFNFGLIAMQRAGNMGAECNTCPYDKKECFARVCGVNLAACVKRYAEENYPTARDYFVNVHLNDEVKSQRYDLLHITAERDELRKENEKLKMEINFMLQRMDADDFQYVQDCIDNETRKDDFEQKLP